MGTLCNDCTPINPICDQNQIQHRMEQPSALAGNIGVIGSRILVWDHDPFNARPNQILTLPMTPTSGKRLGSEANVLFEAGAALLQPEYFPESMPLSVNRIGSYVIEENLDPNTIETEQNKWIHIGNIFERKVYLYPSDSSTNIQGIAAREGVTENVILSQPVWTYATIREQEHDVFTPMMLTKQLPLYSNPVHWTIQRKQPVWQGCDFYIDIYFPDKFPDEGITPPAEEPIENISTQITEYKCLEAYPSSKNGPRENDWYRGIANEAYYSESENGSAKRTGFWANNWKYKSYILVEIGPNSWTGERPNHYFIEFVRGRQPRFICFERTWNPKESPNVGKPIPWCRVLSEFPVSVNELMAQGRIRFLVRNQLGKIVVTFESHLDVPWIISKTGWEKDPNTGDVKELSVPMVVPKDVIMIHGGNLSCRINFSIARYKEQGTIRYTRDRAIQADTHGATDKDLYILLCHMGGTIGSVNQNRLKKVFGDPRWGTFNGKGVRMGYNCDAHKVVEIVKNTRMTTDVYDTFPQQYRFYGKGAKYGTDKRSEWGTLDPDVIKTPSKINIYNLKTSGESDLSFKHSFEFGLPSTSNYPYRDYASEFHIGAYMAAGSATDGTKIPKGDGSNETTEVIYPNSVTPIITVINAHVLGGEKPFKDKVDPIDITKLVTKLSDSWKSEDYSFINHEMQLSCYLPLGEPSSGDLDTYSAAKKLYQLHDKIFYISVAYWWDYGIGQRATLTDIKSNSHPEDSDLQLQMVGVVSKSRFERSNNRLIMNLDVKDYSWILEKQVIYNSPFFDAVSDVTAIYELAKCAGFDDDPKPEFGSSATSEKKVNRKPLGYLRTVQQNPSAYAGKFYYNGETCYTRPYDLPGSYAGILQTNSNTRAQNGETYLSFMKKMAQLGPKTLYWDRFGVLKFENLPSVDAAFSGKRSDKVAPESADRYLQLKSKFDFFSSPLVAGFDINKHANHLIYDTLNYERSVEDCFNQLTIVSASPELKKDSKGDPVGGLIVEGYTFFEQIFDPTAEGFIGFRKIFVQENGVFGGIDEVRRTMQYYAKMKYPITIVNFQTYGVGGLKPLDIITVDGNMFYITEISHDISPDQNKWWMNITGEWLKPFLGSLGQLEKPGEVDIGEGVS